MGDKQLNYNTGSMKDMQETEALINSLRNRNVAQLLDDLGDQPPMLVRSIKRQMTRFSQDVLTIIQGMQDDTEENYNR